MNESAIRTATWLFGLMTQLINLSAISVYIYVALSHRRYTRNLILENQR